MPGKNKNYPSRRKFIKQTALGSTAVLLSPLLGKFAHSQTTDDEKPSTNIQDALKYPRNNSSMPGLFPGRVSEIFHHTPFREGVPDLEIAYNMLAAGMLFLTSAYTPEDLVDFRKIPDWKESLIKSWRMFFTEKDIIGIKVNPVAGKELSTSPQVVQAIITQLEEAGIPRKNLVIWDRREFQLAEAGFTREAFPGIRLTGTECQDEKESFYDADGKLYSESRIDKNWYYYAEVEEEYDAETLPYMVNSGKYSYFSRIVTQEVDKIINVPILKNAGASVTLAMKNLAYGAVTNTGRLHKKLWSETCAEVCAFPPLRDKVVLNIVDGLKGCFNGGPAANAQFIREFNAVLVATDPVAIDRIGYDIILKKRIEEGVQKEESPRGRKFMQLAADLRLGIEDIDRIIRGTVRLS
ncbi:MAG: DUF362 domain-containing protein [Bacteroidales bacterium]